MLDTLGMAAMTFAIGAFAFWMPRYLKSLDVPRCLGVEPRMFFGIVMAVAGLAGTMAGGLCGDWLRRRCSGSYFLVSGVGHAHQRACRLAVRLHLVSRGLGLHLRNRLLPVLQHRTDQHDPGQRGPPLDPRHGLRGEHPDHPLAGRRALADFGRGDRGPLRRA